MMRLLHILLLASATLGLSGCYADPFTDPRKWSMTAAPRENTAVEAANPADLIVGHGDATSNGVAASAGIDKALGGPAGTAAGLQTAPPALNIGGS
jgi:hypothetical protein